ncbi:MAG: acyltransferase [Weizmannia coagulans]|jgi:acetyltransferase-like isoleucine patch superfamily enzyme|uniref:acyltransferase n=1 Tax=Heyndrickxia coagulans TaxID=1398 RepID=UPI0014594EF4|nr:acyltransferase [Heyndrickxia coagulans]MCI1575005.1 acyltransferase [Heyndrickxia coagulans]NMH83999.1 acyltransferase [Heyndrickxia coagulans]
MENNRGKINKRKLEQFIKKNKSLYILFKRFQSKNFINKVSKKIKGKKNKIIISKKSILNGVKIQINGNDNMIIIEDNCILKNVKFCIWGNNHKILIKEHVVFADRGSEIWFEDSDCSLTIGKNSTIEGIHIAVTENNSAVSIGKDCMFSYDVDIRTGDSHSIIDLDSGKRINRAKNIEIGNHVWVGAHCSILKGSYINNNCILGTGSILTKPVIEENVILAGIPAKIIKRNVDWCRKRI